MRHRQGYDLLFQLKVNEISLWVDKGFMRQETTASRKCTQQEQSLRKGPFMSWKSWVEEIVEESFRKGSSGFCHFGVRKDPGGCKSERADRA